MIDEQDMTIAIAPKALGASILVKIMFRANRAACSTALPAPSQVPPRTTFALRPSPSKRAPIISRPRS
jgi:hypothetical protein